MKLCKICLRNSETCNVVDASLYTSVFTQLIGVKAYQELWLCTWCVTILKRIAHFQNMALESQEILKNCTKDSSTPSNTYMYKLTHHENQHIDISPKLDIEDFSEEEIKDENYQTDFEEPNEGILLDEETEMNDSKYLEVTELQIKVRKKYNAEFYKSLGLEVEYLSVKEQKEEIEKIKLSSKYLDMKYKCADCGVGFMIEGDYEEHSLRHNLEHGPHVCSICTLRYKSREVLWQHSLGHSRRFTCVLCSRRMKRADRHKCRSFGGTVDVRRTQNKEKKYICHQCNKSFTSKQRLTVHIRSHTGFKPYPCTICSRTFSTNSNLRSHAAVHSNNKPHYCVECNTYYKTEKNLKRHFAESIRHVNSEDMAYTCSECPKRFSSDKCLQNHIKNRHKTSYKCCHCDKNFYNNANLKKHIRCIHQELK